MQGIYPIQHISSQSEDFYVSGDQYGGSWCGVRYKVMVFGVDRYDNMHY